MLEGVRSGDPVGHSGPRAGFGPNRRGSAAAGIFLLGAIVSSGFAQEPAPSPPRQEALPVPAANAPMSSTAENPFLGGVPEATIPSGSLSLTLSDAVERGLARNLGAILGEQAVRAAQGTRNLARSGLLPTVSAGLTGFREEINLEAYGFPVPSGGSPVVGPFNAIDGRAFVSVPLLDLAAVQRSRAGALDLESAHSGYRDAREIVVLTVAGLYLQAALDAGRVEAARTQRTVAQALYERAVRLKESGVVPGIEVLRAQVQLQAQQQRVIFYENELAKQKLALARAIGLPLAQPYDLSEKLVYVAQPPANVDDALRRAYAARADLRQAESAVRAAEAEVRADRFEALPSLVVNGDVGRIGPNAESLESTFSLSAVLSIPLFQGGRIRARAMQDDAALRQLRARREDLKARVELEVRAALLDLQAADERVLVARGALDLAQEQLRQSEDRFSAGVAGNLEVVQAQDALATASDNFLSALHAHNMARLSLARAEGRAERSLGTFLGGTGEPTHE